MKIPIFNTLYSNSNKKLNTNKINIKSLNNLNLEKVDSNRFPMVKILNYLSNQHSLYDTVIVSANDALVNLYLKKQIKFTDIQDKLFLILKSKELLKFKKVYPSNLREIIELNKYVHLKVLEKVYKS